MKTIFIKSEALSDIILDHKHFELRLDKSYFRDLKIGDTIMFKDSKRNLICSIDNLYKFKNFEHVFENLDFRNFSSRVESKKDMIKFYHTLYNKSKLSVIVFKISKKT